MYKGKRVLGLIPARGGSKRLPGKNIMKFCSQPLIFWTIQAAQKSKYLDSVVVSTDSKMIKRIAEKFNAEVPFLRPKNYAGDKSSSESVILHALDFLSERGESFDIVVLLQPTSPLRTREDIDGAIRKFLSTKADTVVTVSELGHPISWINVLLPGGDMSEFVKNGVVSSSSKELTKYFMPNGSVFVTSSKHIQEGKRLYGKNTYAYIIPRERAVDIDDIVDFKLAEVLMKRNNYKSGKILK